MSETLCANGHPLTGDNIIVRKDRNDSIECRACHRQHRADFASRKPLYDVWRTMLRRCSDPTWKDWHLYGGKVPPITVCERWRDSYEAFELDMSPRPSRQHTLDRINGMQGYRPDNCRWATFKEQSRNAITNRRISFDGRTFTLAEWAEVAGLKYMTLYQRLNRGWSMERAMRPKLLSLRDKEIVQRNEKGQIVRSRSKIDML